MKLTNSQKEVLTSLTHRAERMYGRAFGNPMMFRLIDNPVTCTVVFQCSNDTSVLGLNDTYYMLTANIGPRGAVTDVITHNIDPRFLNIRVN